MCSSRQIDFNINKNNKINLVPDEDCEDIPQVDAFEAATIGWSQIVPDVLDSSQIRIQQIKKELQVLADPVVSIYAYTITTSEKKTD